MILEDETFKSFRYHPKDLKPQSGKPILAACDGCGKVRRTSKAAYRVLCPSCSTKGEKNPNYGKTPTEETKALMSAAKKGKYDGKKNPFFGKHHTKETKAKISAANYKCGKRASQARTDAKRKQLGYILLLPLLKGEVGHHITNIYVMGIPEDVHNSMGGSRKRHRTKILMWLKGNDKKKYKLVLCVLAKE